MTGSYALEEPDEHPIAMRLRANASAICRDAKGVQDNTHVSPRDSRANLHLIKMPSDEKRQVFVPGTSSTTYSVAGPPLEDPTQYHCLGTLRTMPESFFPTTTAINQQDQSYAQILTYLYQPT